MTNLEILLEIQNKTNYQPKIANIKERLKATLLASKTRGKIEIGIMFVGLTRIRSLNKKHRKIDTATDVLSFPTNNKIDQTNLPLDLTRDWPTNNLGDIIVCPQFAIKAIKKHDIDEEIEFLIIHGLKHLIGIHHEEL